MKLIIRKSKRRDIRAVQKVAGSSWFTTYKDIIPLEIQEDFLHTAYSKKTLKQRFIQADFFVAMLGRTVVGIAEYSPLNEKSETNMHALYILDEFQGNGVGTALLQAGMTKLGAKAITISVEGRNEQALQFYRSKGFEVIDSYKDDFHGHQIHTVRMKIRITDGK